jgi:hypothetical protein
MWQRPVHLPLPQVNHKRRHHRGLLLHPGADDCRCTRSYSHGRVRERLRTVWRRPAPPTGARLPPSRASPRTAPHGAAAAGALLRLGADVCRCVPPIVAGESGNGSARCGVVGTPCRCAPPTVAGESENSSARCGGDRHPLSVCASHHRGKTGNGSRCVAAAGAPCWCTPPTIVDESGNGSARCDSGRHPCRCTPPTITGESGNGSAWCGSGQHPPPSRR